ncbi:MAG: peptide-methionine (R)-S-oxide reductase MsrB [Candidatus Diapherotrites archaeon]|uniref:peptide-methionine (R)-S-oxide reductase n=1 Tax=Candidatus Iainarchaeum sp. TaxID=3101447 RepID=A0A8T4L5C8_9ARCH|nr:peptide-methionine (R)-S-oxide reductase MsrB [Candidatus Diapherotrites archaeon]
MFGIFGVIRSQKVSKSLSAEQFRVLFEKGTEIPFTGKWLKNKETGMYVCAACGLDLFSSDAKFDSNCGWPSFDRIANEGNVELKEDKSLGMNRIEVVCRNCGGHLGHLFDDGPTDTGKRFCINSVSLDFRKKIPVSKPG